MTPIQQLMLGAGGAKKVVGIDDVFKTYVYEGSGSSRSINTGLDMTEGGLTWIKNRSGPSSPWFHVLADSARGSSKIIRTNGTNAEYTNTSAITSFNNNGFSLGSAVEVNDDNDDAKYASWSFKKHEKFFTIKQYSGTGSTQSLSHDLGSVPGCIMVKRLDSDYQWVVYHRGVDAANPENYILQLNNNSSRADEDWFGDTAPTSSVFTVSGGATNASDGTYIAYIFAGGESTASEAVSVDFDGSGDYLESNTSSDYSFGTGDFTIEGWYKFDSIGNDGLFMQGSGGISDYTGPTVYYDNSGTNNGLAFRAASSDHTTAKYPITGQWHHIALVRHSGVTKLYLNGTFIKSASDTTNYSNTDIVIGGYYSSSYVMNGQVSNFRVVKGTAVYTSSFRPPTKPLTSISGTALLCCNNSSVTGATTGSVTSAGDPTASTDSPFDDPAGFAFGPNSDQNLIKCGSYIGSGTSGLKVNLPWEPQYILTKRADSTGEWAIFDSIRGVATGTNDAWLVAQGTDAETNNLDYIDFHSDGFSFPNTYSSKNASGGQYVYIAIAAETGRTINSENITAGTDVFAIDGTPVSTEPNFESGFPVDFGLVKLTGGTGNWTATSRVLGTRYLNTDTSGTEGTGATNYTFDLMNGMWKAPLAGTTYQAWMWKRHAGFDLTTHNVASQSGTATIKHQLGVVPEMIWGKSRDNSDSWAVYHKGMNGGTDPQDYYMALNNPNTEQTISDFWGASGPTATSFTIAQTYRALGNHIYMLFASVKGVSHCGYYDGSDSEQTITFPDGGFQPRFIIIKKTNSDNDWVVLDTTRGWGSGVDQRLELNSDGDQSNSVDFGAPTSTGFTLSSYSTSGSTKANKSGDSYIYYAHA